MKDFKKKDYINIGILITIFVGIVIFLTKFSSVYGSLKNWSSQYIIIPEYFRMLFYNTKNLLPSFAFNIGAGQNIFNLSYYGLLNPFILISYLLPFIKMPYFIMGCSVLIVLSSVILIYIWLKNNKYDSSICFLSSFIFLLSGPLIFHSHNHVMLISYMPFLILSFMAIDKYFKTGKRCGVIISVFLVIMTSYYYSLSALIVLFIYGAYKYLNDLKKKERFKFDKFIKWVGKYLISFVIAIMMASVLFLPTFSALFNSRSLDEDINVLALLLPRININYILYSVYSIGLSSIFIVSLVDSFLSKKRGNRLFVIIVAVISLFPIFIYLLNGTLYLDTKVLISFLPFCILTISETLKNIFKKTYDLSKLLSWTIVVGLIILILSRIEFGINLLIDLALLLLFLYEYGESRKKDLIFIPIILVSIISCVVINQFDELVDFDKFDNITSNKEVKLLEKALDKEDDFYRVSNDYLGLTGINKVSLLNEYKASIYSYVSNNNLKDFYYNHIGNEIIYGEFGAMSDVNNVIYNMYMSNKYILTKNNPPIGYKEVSSSGKIKLYKNDKVLPLGYASLNLMSKKDFNKLKFPYNSEALLKNIIVSEKVKSDFKSSIVKKDIGYFIKKSEKLNIFRTKNDIQIRANKNAKLTLSLKETLKDKIVFIKFNVEQHNKCDMGNEEIIINGVSNKLTCIDSKDDNKNTEFKYVLSSNDPVSEAVLEFSRGLHKISNIETYIMDYNSIGEIHNNIDQFEINKKKTVGDVIVGNINVSQDKYFHLSVPYDKGFSIYVDGEKVDYYRSDIDFIGFKIKKGRHKILIRYDAPLLKAGIFISVFGIICFGNVLFFEFIRNKSDVPKKKKKSKTKKKKTKDKKKNRFIGLIFNRRKTNKSKKDKKVKKLDKKTDDISTELIKKNNTNKKEKSKKISTRKKKVTTTKKPTKGKVNRKNSKKKK